MRGVICQKPSDLAEKLTCEPETDIRHCAASPELWLRAAVSCNELRRLLGGQSANSLQLLERPLHGESKFVRQSA